VFQISLVPTRIRVQPLNHQPFEEEKMDWKSQFKVHDLSFRKTCIVLLVIAVCEVILLLFIPPWQPNSETVSHFRCGRKQRWIYRIMSEVPDGDEFELPPEWTVADLIREAVGKNLQTSRPLPESVFTCRNIRKVRVHAFPYLRRERVEVTSPYLVFPVPASIMFDDSLQQPVPILMCPPGAHDQDGSMVLYSDGSTKKLTTEEADKLVSEYHPESFNFSVEATAENDRKQTEARLE
jgi:hypothetical protein